MYNRDFTCFNLRCYLLWNDFCFGYCSEIGSYLHCSANAIWIVIWSPNGSC